MFFIKAWVLMAAPVAGVGFGVSSRREKQQLNQINFMAFLAMGNDLSLPGWVLSILSVIFFVWFCFGRPTPDVKLSIMAMIILGSLNGRIIYALVMDDNRCAAYVMICVDVITAAFLCWYSYRAFNPRKLTQKTLDTWGQADAEPHDINGKIIGWKSRQTHDHFSKDEI